MLYFGPESKRHRRKAPVEAGRTGHRLVQYSCTGRRGEIAREAKKSVSMSAADHPTEPAHRFLFLLLFFFLLRTPALFPLFSSSSFPSRPNTNTRADAAVPLLFIASFSGRSRSGSTSRPRQVLSSPAHGYIGHNYIGP